jgi:sulfonate transport system substrate-binding protein
MMAQHEVKDGARLFYRKPEANTWGILNVREEFAKDHPDVVRRTISAYEEARKFSLANYDELKRIFIAVTALEPAIVDKQLKERTGLTFNKVGPEQRESILEAGLALQKGGVIKADVDVKKVLDDLIDDRYVTVTN